jgi:uncharacterized protein YcbX
MAWTGAALRLGEATTTVFKPIIRCAAIDVDPTTAVRGEELVKALWEHYGHAFCGLYLHVTGSGRVASGDTATLVVQPEPAA